VPYANLENPQSLNLYSYVLNNPVTATDPDGHDSCFGWASAAYRWISGYSDWSTTSEHTETPPLPSPPPAPPVAELKTSIRGNTTTFQTYSAKDGYREPALSVATIPSPGGHRLGVSPPGQSAAVGTSAIWAPGPAALAELASAAAKWKTRTDLLSIMRRFGASPQAVAFAETFPGDPAFLSSLDRDGFLGGFAVGTIKYPFRGARPKGFVMLNGTPPIVDVSDRNLLKNIQLDRAATLKALGTAPDQLRCDWSRPLSYEAGRGSIPNGTFFDVSYPILSAESHRVLGIVHVDFQFGEPHWRFYGTSLEFVEALHASGK